ncbi:MAG: divalent metal cation transporter [Planctomycetes bacterium]|nr:divalent metal cation transporter [Planctomycetota bacterium]MCH9727712.1 divalent metal cation transporter [Planctomycetota bacterium]MCH9776963.1 divalent metal cation transporter [Planctomycetota bacterium]MCH9789854.1 divalent metal cation transporter [Planctomycetota bacterium]MDF1745814.1 divalent metal cation transporter [Gimesia sp.]
MTEEPANSRIEQDRQQILEAQQQGAGAKIKVYTKLSGPGWLQSAITLGGGSLAGGLYLGILSGYHLMWLQPLAMIMGVIMLSAIGYVALSTKERPFASINNHISPVLGWGWAIATLMANLIWCMPQYALGTAALQQNLAPEIFANGENGKYLAAAALFLVSGVVIWFYDSGGWGIKLFEAILKIMVGIVVLCFFGVVLKMSLSTNDLDWAKILAGYIPNLSMFSNPSPEFSDMLSQAGGYAEYWKKLIVGNQQKVMITAAATAVGINMTFLLPYSMRAKGWDKDFRGLAAFDLSTGLFVPFLLATSCVVIAAASQFHAKPAAGLLGEKNAQGQVVQADPGLLGQYNKLLDSRLKKELPEATWNELKENKTALEQKRAALPLPERTLAAMLVNRDAFQLASSLKPLAGETVSQLVFGLGVVAMAISTIIILMLINGFVFCEMLGVEPRGTYHRIGCYMPAITGMVGSFFWSGNAKAWLAVPTSMFGMVLLPIAYLTFFFMMNSPKILGENMPRGGKRVAWNLAMGISTLCAAFGCVWSIKSSAFAVYGFSALGIFIGLAIIVHILRLSKSDTSNTEAN